MVQSCDWFIW